MEGILQDSVIKIKRVDNFFLSSSSYLVYNENPSLCFLIDCGDTDTLLDSIKDMNLELSLILLTHCHCDHIYGLNELLEVYPNIIVVTNNEGKIGLYSDKVNLSKYHDRSFIYKGSRIYCIEDEYTISILEKMGIEVVKTPGHHPSCLSYRFGNYFFTGDSYIPGNKVITSLPKGNKVVANISTQKICDFAKSEKLQVLSGHFLKQIG